jgi:hypothetical protein
MKCVVHHHCPTVTVCACAYEEPSKQVGECACVRAMNTRIAVSVVRRSHATTCEGYGHVMVWTSATQLKSLLSVLLLRRCCHAEQRAEQELIHAPRMSISRSLSVLVNCGARDTISAEMRGMSAQGADLAPHSFVEARGAMKAPTK